jgi:hypothetical protein
MLILLYNFCIFTVQDFVTPLFLFLYLKGIKSSRNVLQVST